MLRVPPGPGASPAPPPLLSLQEVNSQILSFLSDLAFEEPWTASLTAALAPLGHVRVSEAAPRPRGKGSLRGGGRLVGGAGVGRALSPQGCRSGKSFVGGGAPRVACLAEADARRVASAVRPETAWPEMLPGVSSHLGGASMNSPLLPRWGLRGSLCASRCAALGLRCRSWAGGPGALLPQGQRGTGSSPPCPSRVSFGHWVETLPPSLAQGGFSSRAGVFHPHAGHPPPPLCQASPPALHPGCAEPVYPHRPARLLGELLHRHLARPPVG